MLRHFVTEKMPKTPLKKEANKTEILHIFIKLLFLQYYKILVVVTVVDIS